jgi:hypothetical protein
MLTWPSPGPIDVICAAAGNADDKATALAVASNVALMIGISPVPGGRRNAKAPSKARGPSGSKFASRFRPSQIQKTKA